MTHLCPECAKRVISIGFHAYTLLERACDHYFEGQSLIYKSNEERKDALESILHYMESKGYLLSCEVDDKFIAIIPNIYTAWKHPEFESLCWCHLQIE